MRLPSLFVLASLLLQLLAPSAPTVLGQTLPTPTATQPATQTPTATASPTLTATQRLGLVVASDLGGMTRLAAGFYHSLAVQAPAPPAPAPGDPWPLANETVAVVLQQPE